MKYFLSLILVLGLTWGAFSSSVFCSSIWSEYSQFQYTRGFQGIAYAAADALENNIVFDLDRTKPILFTSFVDIDNLQSSSTFGRLLGEQVASRLAQHGYKLVELKLRINSLIIRQGLGEIALSRELKNIRENNNAQAILVGTYAVVDNICIITVRLIGAKHGTMLATHDFTLQLDSKLQKLVKQSSSFQKTKNTESKIAEGPLGKGAVLLDPKKSISSKIIQTRLAQLDYYHDRIDGIWGKNSKKALQSYKVKHNLSEPSRWDLKTQIKLFEGTGQ